jgi:hypothetical protein
MSKAPEKQILNIDLSSVEDLERYQEVIPVLITLETLGLKEITICESMKPELLKKKYTLEFWEDKEGVATFTLKDVTNDN